jgi:hypothetical protein
MARFNRRGWQRGVVAAAAVALGVVIGAAVPVSAEEPSPTPFTAAGDAPMEMARPQAGGRRPDPQATSGNLLVHDGRFRSLPDAPGALITVHRGLDGLGRTVGTYIDDGAVPGPDGFFPAETIHGFVYDHGRFRTIDIPGLVAFPYDINNRGQIVGVYVDPNAVPGPDGLPPPGAQHAFLWERGRVTIIDPPDTVYAPNAYSINDRGQVVGVRIGADGHQIGFLRQNDGTYVDLDPPGASENKALGINDRGEVVGAYLDDGAEPGPDGLYDPGTVHGYRWQDGRYTRLDVPGARASVAFDIDNRGRIVGDFKDADGQIRGFIHDDTGSRSGPDGHGRRDRRDRYTVIDGPGERSDTLIIHNNDRGDAVIPAPGTIDAIENIVR